MKNAWLRRTSAAAAVRDQSGGVVHVQLLAHERIFRQPGEKSPSLKPILPARRGEDLFFNSLKGARNFLKILDPGEMPSAWDGEKSHVCFFLKLRASLINIHRRNDVVFSGKAEHGYRPQINRHLIVREKIIIADQKSSIGIRIPINQL
ncbi:MAG: hypothetical protein M0D55_04395 [Elusimicrobiota bacterium]|nr:MAG: hypothetical protein M0D55_04395 [Elusimicrobiota bacterium]